MGVKELWSILEPVAEKISLDDLSGSVVAVDLGFWICQSQAAVTNPNVPKPYLRNLFFRISALLKRNIRLVFVNEGTPPEVKRQTMQQRQKGRSNRNQINPQKTLKRTKFNYCLKECCDMIRAIGLTVVDSEGEAEACCAALNSENIVDAVITDDGDALLYGARCVYRNFNLDGKLPTVDCYKIERIEESLNLNRRKLIALALMVGCDYCPKGVPGIGKENALKFMNAFDDNDILQRLQTLSIKDHLFDHTLSKAEQFIKKRLDDDFAPDDIIHEYLHNQKLPLNLTKDRICWQHPSLSDLYNILFRQLEWPADYVIAKVIPLITLWTLTRNEVEFHSPTIKAHRIIKQRVKDRTPVFEVQWGKLKSDIWTDKEFYVTLETQTLIETAYPRLVDDFLQQSVRVKSAKPSKSRKMTKKQLTPPLDEEHLDNSIILFNDDEMETLAEQWFSIGYKFKGNNEESDKENREMDDLAEKLQVKVVISDLETQQKQLNEDVGSSSNELRSSDSSAVTPTTPLPLFKRLHSLMPERLKNSALLNK